MTGYSDVSSLWLDAGLGPVPSLWALEFAVYLLGQSRDTNLSLLAQATFYGMVSGWTRDLDLCVQSF